MALSILRVSLGILLWGTVLLGALSITSWSGDWGHSLCGPWGCAPKLQALVACHTAWIVLLVPLAILARINLPTKMSRWIGAAAAIAGVFGCIAIVLYQTYSWFPQAGDWQRPFLPQRCLFVIVTSIDIPIAQLLAIGSVLWLAGCRARQTIEMRSRHTELVASAETSASS